MSNVFSASRRVFALGALGTVALAACAESPTETALADPLTAATTPLVAEASRVVPNQFIVQFHDGETDPAGLARKLVASQGGTLRHTYTHALKGFAATLPPQAVEALRRNPRVKLVEPDAVVAVASSGSQSAPPSWGLDRIDQRTRPYDSRYTWPNSGAGAHIYIFDTGIRSTHEEFRGRVGAGYTAISDGRGTEDCHGHGTNVAALAGGTLYGVAKGATLHAVRVMGCDGTGATSAIISALDWATRNALRPAVVNMSLGGEFHAALNTAVENTSSAGLTVVVSAGNWAIDACQHSPASAPSAITTGAADILDRYAPFSNWGPCVDLFAPGVSVVTAHHTGDSDTRQNGGTSMSAPHAAGAAAIVLATNPGASPAQVQAALVNSASAGVLASLPATTPNRLLFIGAVEGTPAPAPPPPTNTAPTVSFSTNCTNLTCSFTDGSSDADGSIVSYAWSFGDGSSSADRHPTRSYTTAGSYSVRLVVTDDQGATASTTRTVTVSAPTNNAPVASFAFVCKGNRSSCEFDASTSTDDAGIVRYEWNFGDGSTSVTFAGPRASYRYPRTGTFTVTLTVHDAQGLVGRTTRSISVRRL